MKSIRASATFAPAAAIGWPISPAHGVYSDGHTENAIVDSLENAPPRYQLAYESPPPDGKYHKLRVVCTCKGVKIESRRGYFADQP
jgi:hypothetical protein